MFLPFPIFQHPRDKEGTHEGGEADKKPERLDIRKGTSPTTINYPLRRSLYLRSQHSKRATRSFTLRKSRSPTAMAGPVGSTINVDANSLLKNFLLQVPSHLSHILGAAEVAPITFIRAKPEDL